MVCVPLMVPGLLISFSCKKIVLVTGTQATVVTSIVNDTLSVIEALSGIATPKVDEATAIIGPPIE